MKGKEEVISEFNEYVNMTAEELESWLKSGDSNSAGWPKDDAEGDGETVGHDSGRKIVEILKENPEKKEDEYTDDQVEHMRKVVAYCKRHLAQETKSNSDKSPEEVKKTKSYASLKNWGHDFLKAQGKDGEEKEEEKPSESNGERKAEANGKEKNGKKEDENGDTKEGKANEEEEAKVEEEYKEEEEEAKEESKEEEKGDDEVELVDDGDETKEKADDADEEKTGDKRKKSNQDDGSNKKRQTRQGEGKATEKSDANDDAADEKEEEISEEDGDEEMADDDDDDDEKENGGGNKTKKGPKKGDTVSWNWGNGQPEGKVLDVKEEKTTIQTKRGNEVSRDGNPDDPAVVLDTGKSKAIKANHELN